MPLRIYNSLTRTKEEFVPLHDNRVGMYVCGPTVYGHAHIGHAKSYVSFDAVQRYLRYRGYDVTYVQNITDVGHLVGDVEEGEDKVQKEARQRGANPFAIAQSYEVSYWHDMDRMNVQRPDISCRATGHIMEQIEIIQTLIERGFAYESNGSVYFDVARDAEYGKLSNRRVEDMVAGARVAVRDEKRNAIDFALWKRADAEHLMQWKSPWGMGYPGWHVECSAMSMKYLGASFDIHGGGIENQFPHHECEIAQSECATGKPFVKYWMHNNMVTVDGKKMGKSMGNASNLRDLFEIADPIALRFFILQSHYRSTLEFSLEAIAAASDGLQGLHETVRRIQQAVSQVAETGSGDSKVNAEIATARQSFVEAMDDDFNVPLAIGALFGLKTAANSALDRGDVGRAAISELAATFDELGDRVLGIMPSAASAATGPDVADALMQLIIGLRSEARSRKDFATSDRIRDGLQTAGIVLEDGKQRTAWKFVR